VGSVTGKNMKALGKLFTETMSIYTVTEKCSPTIKPNFTATASHGLRIYRTRWSCLAKYTQQLRSSTGDSTRRMSLNS
jgi:hypothetical protein